MKITDVELLTIIDEVAITLGELLLNHRELSESLLDTQQTERAKERIDTLRKQIEGERADLAKIRQSQSRKKELERVRKDHAKDANGCAALLEDARDGQSLAFGELMQLEKLCLNRKDLPIALVS